MGLPIAKSVIKSNPVLTANAIISNGVLRTHHDKVIPVEVRAGTSGSLKSTHVFLAEKARRFAVRFNLGRPSMGDFTVEIGGKTGAQTVSFTLLSLPLYLAGQFDRLIREQYRKEAS